MHNGNNRAFEQTRNWLLFFKNIQLGLFQWLGSIYCNLACPLFSFLIIFQDLQTTEFCDKRCTERTKRKTTLLFIFFCSLVIRMVSPWQNKQKKNTPKEHEADTELTVINSLSHALTGTHERMNTTVAVLKYTIKHFLLWYFIFWQYRDAFLYLKTYNNQWWVFGGDGTD